MMSTHVILQTPNLEVLFRQGKSEYALIAFGPATQLANGTTFWGQAIADRGDLTAIGIMGRNASWYPDADIRQARSVILNALQGYTQIIGYGSSMGGYGVMKHGRTLGITHGLSFAPQWSIDPRDVGSWDKRFLPSYVSELHKEMAICRNDAPAQSYMFYDPFFKEDMLNARHIIEVTPSVVEIRAYLTGHYPISLARGTANVLSLFAKCLAGDSDGIRQAAGAIRRDRDLAIRAPFYAEIVGQQNPDRALRIHEKYREKFDEGHTFLLYHKLTGAFMDMGRFAEAVSLSDVCLTFGTKSRDPYIRRSVLEDRRGNKAAAYKFAEEAVQRWPGATTKMQLVSLLMADKKRSKAISLLRTILEVDACHLPATRAMLQLAHDSRDQVETEYWIGRLLALDRSPDTFARLGNIYEDIKQYHEAESNYLKAVEIDRDYAHGWQRLTNFYLNTPKWGAAIEAAENVVRCLPNRPEGYRSIAQACKGFGFFDKAEYWHKEADKRAGALASLPVGAQREISEGKSVKRRLRRLTSFARGALRSAMENIVTIRANLP